MAAPLPRFCGWRSSRTTPGWRRTNSSTMRSEPSVEPSSTTTISRSRPSGSGATSARPNMDAIYSSSLKSGTRIDKREAGTRGIVSASITKGADQRRKFALPKNEDGEFELILGNRQLLSVFFIVVILLGVFFTMGYIVGRNSGPVAAETTPVPSVDARPAAVESPASASAPVPVPSTPTETAPQQPAPA